MLFFEMVCNNLVALEQLKAANAELSRRLSACEMQLATAEDVILNLREARQPNMAAAVDGREQVKMFEAQLAFYKEDFESERRDRERAQARLADAEQRNVILQRKV